MYFKITWQQSKCVTKEKQSGCHKHFVQQATQPDGCLQQPDLDAVDVLEDVGLSQVGHFCGTGSTVVVNGREHAS